MNIIISACLLGENCKYNGGNNLVDNLIKDFKDYNIIPICPEVMGGLDIPRKPCERLDNKVITIDNEDFTNYFYKGAYKALDIAKENNAKYAILKSKSPSCGKGYIYDGTFSHTLTENDGVCAQLFRENGIEIYTEKDYKNLLKKLDLG
ncbi:MAG: DUF523 domain-containing protein [Tissierellia bacterium]|nr:DUF523 domain-containing protein [Tissierellia bacterium]